MFPAEQSERFSFQAVIGRCNLAQQIVGQLLCVHTLRDVPHVARVWHRGVAS